MSHLNSVMFNLKLSLFELNLKTFLLFNWPYPEKNRKTKNKIEKNFNPFIGIINPKNTNIYLNIYVVG